MKSDSRIGSVALGVDGCELPTLLDADVQAPRREVVDESELHLPLHRHRTVPAHVYYLKVQNAMLRIPFVRGMDPDPSIIKRK
jgi:hypothetical protein